MSEKTEKAGGQRRRAVADAAIAALVQDQARAAGPDGSIGPNDVAKALGGEDWRTLTGRVRQAAIRLAEEGRLVILRKGRPADPSAFKGVYRLRIAAADHDAANGGER